MDVSQVGLRFRCIEVLVPTVVKVIIQPRLAVAFSKILALSFFFEILFRHTGTSITFENRGTPAFHYEKYDEQLETIHLRTE